tara:strand:+ start:351 stop:908 length:558 start_codon:yes stop_codon:yes gene_type:complete
LINKKITCSGSKIHLRSLRIEDHQVIKNWCKEENNINYFPNTNFLQEIKSEFWLLNKINDKNGIYMAIICRKKKKIIGITILENIDLNNKNAFWGIYMSNNQYHKFDYCFEASQHIINYAFKKLNLNKIYLNTLASNKRGRKFHKQLGFTEEAVFNNQILVDGYYTNLIWSSLERKNWKLMMIQK